MPGRSGPSTFTCARFFKILAHVNVLGKNIACWAALHLARMIGQEHSANRVVRPRDCNEADLIGGARLCCCGNLAGALCPKLPCDRCEMRSAHSRCRVSRNLITTVLVARQDSGGRITRAWRTYIHMARRQRMVGSEPVQQQVTACCDRVVTVL